MATGNDIGLSQPAASTITMKIATVTQDWNSTVRHQELLTLAGGESTLEIARVQATAPASTAMGLVVRIAGGPSSAADLLARVNQGVGNSTAADRWRVETANSSAADYRAVRLVDSSGSGFHGPSNPLPIVAITPASWANLAISTAGQSTNTPVLSSAATTPYVSGFTAVSTEAGPIVCAFTAGSTVLWPILLWAEGGVPSVHQSVGQTGFIFKGQADRPLEFRILSGSTGTVYLGVTYKQE